MTETLPSDSRLHWQPEYLANDVVRLRPLAATDFDALYAVASDPLIWEQHPDSDRWQEPVFRVFFDGALVCGTAFIVEDAQSGEAIGSSRYYDINEEDRSVAIGYTFLARRCWGGRYNRSLKQLMLDHAFQFVDRVYLHIGAYNFRSQLATRRLGALEVGPYRNEAVAGAVEHLEFRLDKDVWLQNRTS